MIHVEFRFTVLEELAEFEEGCPLKEKFGDDTSSAEDIHSFGHSSILPSLDILAQLRLLGTNLGILTRRVEPFWRDITSSASRSVKVEREVRRVVEWEICRLVRSEVGDIDPIPRGDEDIFAFDVSMRDLAVASITKGCKDLECDPFLLDGRKEGPSTEPSTP